MAQPVENQLGHYRADNGDYCRDCGMTGIEIRATMKPCPYKEYRKPVPAPTAQPIPAPTPSQPVPTPADTRRDQLGEALSRANQAVRRW